MVTPIIGRFIRMTVSFESAKEKNKPQRHGDTERKNAPIIPISQCLCASVVELHMIKPMKFTKMHGIGNDYVYVNCFDENLADPSGIAPQSTDRPTGIVT